MHALYSELVVCVHNTRLYAMYRCACANEQFKNRLNVLFTFYSLITICTSKWANKSSVLVNVLDGCKCNLGKNHGYHQHNSCHVKGHSCINLAICMHGLEVRDCQPICCVLLKVTAKLMICN